MLLPVSTHLVSPRLGLHARSTVGCRLLRLCALALLLVGAIMDVSYAAERRASPPPTVAAELSPMAPVTLNGHVLFKVRGVSAFPAEQRASLIEERLRSVAENESLPLDSLRIEEGTDRSLVKFSDELVVTVLDVDAEIEGVPRQLLAEMYRNLIRTEVAASVANQADENRLRLVVFRGDGPANPAIGIRLFLLLTHLPKHTTCQDQGCDDPYRQMCSVAPI